ncbi:BolA family transcriptional regulator [Candidatus Trichorickettsia mobilis]|uniref:BolA family transcriptional regulator n=1 Tax=Candidatus Trichorickettsia mobilis TaxID=1346319 RepID=A0ABZ0UVF5_9RICK|nr:BolA family protein [Candidatus Trichorickettsia mobilis]WPY01077.1 BolA family transcriptional regulator [Candidatus Trichorickettsia mobilis]
MQRSERIKQKLAALKPHHLEIIDQTSLHVGHAEHADDSETHFFIKISADILKEKTRLEQHNIINKLLDDEFNNGLHALSIKICT